MQLRRSGRLGGCGKSKKKHFYHPFVEFRKLKDHLKKEANRQEEISSILSAAMTPWFNRFLFLSRLFGINVSIHRPHAEFSEFRLLIQRLRFGGDPNLILKLMLNASINKRNCTDSKS